MHINGTPSQQLQSSLKLFAQYLAGLHRLPTFGSVSEAEEKAHERLKIGFEEMDGKEMQIILMMQQMVEVYARDRQMQIARRNPFEVIIEMDEAEVKNGYTF